MAGRGDRGRARGRGRGRGRSGGRQQPATYAGRGPQASRGGGQGRGRGGAPPPAPFQQPRAESVATLHEEVEQKLSLGASASAPAQSIQSEGPPAAVIHQPEQSVLPPASTKSVRHPPRPGFGTSGTKVIVKANHFLAAVADSDLSHYDVTISPEVASKKVCREIIEQLVATFKDSHLGKRKLAYDGRKSCYSAGPLPFESKDFDVKLVDRDRQDRERKFKVSLKLASKPSLHHLQQFIQSRQLDLPQETLQLLDVVLREKPSKIYTVVGRSFFSDKLGDVGGLGDGLVYWKGFYQSLRPTQMGLSLNIDTSARAFLQPLMVLEYIFQHFHEDMTRDCLSDQDRIKVKKALRGVWVETNNQGVRRRYKISGITQQSTEQLMFSMDGKQISVAQYFLEKYGVGLRYPKLPAIQAGSDTKPIYLPMEHCRIVEGQRYTRKLNQKQVTSLLRVTCQRPEDRENLIFGMVKHNNYNNDDIVNIEFGIQVRPELVSIEARVLTPPKLQYHETGRNCGLVTPSLGQWNMIDKKMVNGGKLDFWTCVNFSSTSNVNVVGFCNNLIMMCCTNGMDCKLEPLIPIRDANQGAIGRALVDVEAASTLELAKRKLSEKKLQLLIVILPDTSGSYGTIKRVCETELGIVSQCCLSKNMSKPDKQYRKYMENISLKINAKVGGRNSVLEQALLRKMPCLKDPTIIFGADVTHPQPGEDSSPSIAAVVASMDWPEVTKYRGLCSAQAHREEIIQDLYSKRQDPEKGEIHGGLIREHLLSFHKSTRMKPSRIIFYRDGVSEGQFSQVLFHEMGAIRKACYSIEENYMPKVTFIVVQKRHHTRLFPANRGDRETTHWSGNILPGTVVDTRICHPTEFDFYLCSHAGIQGTSRPAHYHVLYNENNFTADDLQKLSYSLCYTYARCTRSVSIVPPAYYAHLAAYRARHYIEGTDYSDSGSTSDGGGRANRERNREVRPLPEIKDNVKDVMFYI